jgi:hypothetical protein
LAYFSSNIAPDFYIAWTYIMKMEIICITEESVLVRMSGTHIVKIPLIGMSEEHELIKHAGSFRLGLAQGLMKAVI